MIISSHKSAGLLARIGLAACALLLAAPAMAAGEAGPISLRDQGFFWVGVRSKAVETPPRGGGAPVRGTSIDGQMYVGFQLPARKRHPYPLVLVHGRDLPTTAVVEIGWDTKIFGDKQLPPAFHLVAATGVVASERTRWSWDDEVVTQEQEAISTALTQDPDDHALLVPGRSYTVTVNWRAASLKQDTEPTSAPTWDGGHTDTYRFTADGADEAPTDLGPWVLTSAPGMDDVGVLCKEPIRIALATVSGSAIGSPRTMGAAPSAWKPHIIGRRVAGPLAAYSQ